MDTEQWRFETNNPDDGFNQYFDLLNLMSNQSFVQFLHRSFAYLIIFFVVFLGVKMLIQKKTKFQFINFYLVIIKRRPKITHPLWQFLIKN